MTKARTTEASESRPAGWRMVVRIVLTVVSVAAIWVALALPGELPQFSPQAFIRLSLVALAVAAIVTVLPARWARWVAVLAGVAAGALVLLKLLDIAFIYVLGAPFDPRTDWSEVVDGFAVLRGSVGGSTSVIILAATIVGVLLIFVGLAFAARRIATATTSRRRLARRLIAGLTAFWLIFAVVGVDAGGGPVATISGAQLTHLQPPTLHLGPDPWATVPADQLLTGLRGHDVLLVFVESYGRVAVQKSSAAPNIAPAVDSDLVTQTKALTAAGYQARTGYLTSPTFGGLSWQAHLTLQGGVWINSAATYNQVFASNRTTLSSAFGKAGWRSVGVQPADTMPWPQGESFYHWSSLYDNMGGKTTAKTTSKTTGKTTHMAGAKTDLGYVGPWFGLFKVPDEYTLKSFGQLALQGPHKPVMAEIDLVSSHGPWATIPKLLPWQQVGDESLYPPMTKGDLSAATYLKSPSLQKQGYQTSIIYSMNSLVSFLQHVNDPNLVVIALGDHQPAASVSGQNPSHDVPISIISDDPKVLSAPAGWNWTSGLVPATNAPVWQMSAFRNKFLSAYSSVGH